MDAATKAQNVVDPELLFPCAFELEKLGLPAAYSISAGQWLIEANACWGALQLGELTLLSDAEEDFEFHAERIPHLCQLASAVLAKLFALASTEGIANVPNNPSTANAVLEPPAISEKRIAVQVFVDLRFSILAKSCGIFCHLQVALCK